METFRYDTAPITPRLWRHQTCPLQFSLVVDYFGVKYERQADINHILDAQNKSTQYMRNGMASYKM